MGMNAEEESLEATSENRHRGRGHDMLGKTVPSTGSSNREGPIADGGRPYTTDRVCIEFYVSFSIKYTNFVNSSASASSIIVVNIPAKNVTFQEVFSGHHHLILTVSWLVCSNFETVLPFKVYNMI